MVTAYRQEGYHYRLLILVAPERCVLKTQTSQNATERNRTRPNKKDPDPQISPERGGSGGHLSAAAEERRVRF